MELVNMLQRVNFVLTRPCASPLRASVCRSVLLGVLAMVSQLAAAETIRVGGAGAGLATMKLLAQAFQKTEPQVQIDVMANLGSSGGVKALVQGKIQVAVVGRPLKKDEEKDGLTAFEYGKTPFIFVTSGKARQESLSLEKIASIYSGKVTNWADGTPIRLVLRPANDSDTEALAAMSPSIKTALDHAMTRPGMVVGSTDQDSADQMERLSGSLGTSTLAVMLSEKRALYALPVSGVVPSVLTGEKGSYPYFKSLSMVTKGQASPAVARFLSFVRSEEGRRILADNGHWVAK